MFGNPDAERRILESTYEDRCTIYRYHENENGHITELEPNVIYKDIRCALSQYNLAPVYQSETKAEIIYDSKLFLSPDIDIKANDKFEVTRFGKVYKFDSSGEPFVYATHQEIMLKRRDRS